MNETRCFFHIFVYFDRLIRTIRDGHKQKIQFAFTITW